MDEGEEIKVSADGSQKREGERGEGRSFFFKELYYFVVYILLYYIVKKIERLYCKMLVLVNSSYGFLNLNSLK